VTLDGRAEGGNFEGKVALVTGAGSGIGRAIAVSFAQRGASVVVADVNEAGAIGTTRAIDGNAVAVGADVVDGDAVARMVQTAVDRFGGLDCAVNNAGIAPDAKPFTEHTLAEWQRTIDVDLTGVFLCMQHELRQFSVEGRGGAIVNISSAAGTVPAPGQPQYTAAKHGVLGLTKQAAQEFAAQGVRVNAVMPGQTETGPMRAYLEALPDQGARMLRRLPMGRMATPEEIAQAVVWLCSDDASYVNGVSLLVDGGLIAR
jgi:NAD(P)-dependent dehydrogenase (short-subunit alcohol dehydrogenase family)